MVEWYSQKKDELKKQISRYISSKNPKKIKQTPNKIHGIIVPHAGYQFSGKIAGKAFSLIENQEIEKAVIIGPSHYEGFQGIKIMKKTKSPLGKINFPDKKTSKYDFLEYEHSVDNQIPFLQYLNPEIEILPLVAGNLDEDNIKPITKQIIDELDEKTILVVSTDLSHFLTYREAIEKDNETIKNIENLNSEKLMEEQNSACGIFPLLILIEICKEMDWKPQLVEYKNSYDIFSEMGKDSVVGYAGMVF